jgi:hypothetical protein
MDVNIFVQNVTRVNMELHNANVVSNLYLATDCKQYSVSCDFTWALIFDLVIHCKFRKIYLDFK